MADNRMKYRIDSNMQFPLVEIDLEKGESIYLQHGSMVYHNPEVELTTKLNSKGSGLGKLVGAIGVQWYRENQFLSPKRTLVVITAKLR
ncbi:hypothetical protein SuUB23_01920 [Streptococcus uberis]